MLYALGRIIQFTCKQINMLGKLMVNKTRGCQVME